MADDKNWMPLYLGDYLRDTGALSMAEHGAYLLLLAEYWTHGRLGEDGDCYAIARARSPAERRAVDKVLARFFPRVDGRRWNKRQEEELAKHSQIRANLSTRGKAAAEARWHAKRMPVASDGDASSMQQAVLEQYPTPSPIKPTTSDDVVGTHSDASGNASRKKPRRPMPADFAPSEGHRTLAGSLGVNLDVEFPAFRDHHGSVGSVFSSWDLALNTWIRKAARFQRGRPNSPGSGRHGGFQGRDYGLGLGPGGKL